MPRFLCFLFEKCKKGPEPLTAGSKNDRIHFALSNRGIAQLVEQWSPKPRAEGSSPSAPAKDNGRIYPVVFLLSGKNEPERVRAIRADPCRFSVQEFQIAAASLCAIRPRQGGGIGAEALCEHACRHSGRRVGFQGIKKFDCVKITLQPRCILEDPAFIL